MTAKDVDRFETSRSRLETIAYRLLGSAGEAEDVVQETFLRRQAASRSPRPGCLNQLASARRSWPRTAGCL
ncbi:sigma factor [Nonomuraea rosea]|uniref:sigma factor n=1 Tax=Nonomuraea rosea TaxID=638574 RepID=UPI0031E75473